MACFELRILPMKNPYRIGKIRSGKFPLILHLKGRYFKKIEDDHISLATAY